MSFSVLHDLLKNGFQTSGAVTRLVAFLLAGTLMADSEAIDRAHRLRRSVAGQPLRSYRGAHVRRDHTGGHTLEIVIQLETPSLTKVLDPCSPIWTSPGLPSIVSPGAGRTFKCDPPTTSATITS